MLGFGRFLNGRATLLASVALTSTGMLGMAVPAIGQDATWLANPGSPDYNTATNWTPVAVPTGTRVLRQL
ncbi:MAG: hypothetical protein JWR80_7757 [Bradyrhizobium sp.]|nr:hypothetical protein [Bradyrhizobium sp.]